MEKPIGVSSPSTNNVPLQLLTLMIVIVLFFTVMNMKARADPTNNLCQLGSEKVTKLRFYVQDWVGGDRPTVWEVARSNLTGLLPSGFGLVSVLDNPVTSGPETESGEVGRIQGLIGHSDLRELSLFMVLNVVFTKDGYYKGSTLSFLGRNPLDEETREVPVVAGTGAFRMARGYAVTSTYAVDDARTHGVIQYDVVVFHHHHAELADLLIMMENN